ncbi:recombinase RecT [Paenibacillus kribbensis]|uniref:RecT family recombinase n=1 Tax=Paenibacillus kribbensis TaxID=172713 RepID=UPI002DB65121|nr:RecT family recombinase [Paenibacillus kribbensis]MEC0237796.1 recombinase RecT [Paenibacillus kribbensis]
MANTNNQLQAIQEEVVVGNYTQKHLDTLKSTIAKGTSNEQFALFVQTCVRTGLDPFLNQIFCIVYNGKDGPVMSMQIAVEGIVALAKKHPQYKGFIASEIRANDHFTAKMHSGEVEHEPAVMNPGETVGAYCIAYRDDAPNILVIVRRDQVEHLIKGRNGQMWKDYFDDMIVKHAIKRAFKRQYGIEVSEDEPTNANPSIDKVSPYERRDITAESDAAAAVQAAKQGEPSLPGGEPEPSISPLEQARADMKKKFSQLGITDPADMQAYILEHANPKGAKPTLAELKGLLKIMDLHLAEKTAQEQANDELPI